VLQCAAGSRSVQGPAQGTARTGQDRVPPAGAVRAEVAAKPHEHYIANLPA
jgi:hypothetical protein